MSAPMPMDGQQALCRVDTYCPQPSQSVVACQGGVGSPALHDQALPFFQFPPNMFKGQNGQFSPPSTSNVLLNGDDCNEDTNPFYCLPSGGPSEDRTSSVTWWDDVQTWHAALWRAAVLRSAFNVATNGANCLDAETEQAPARMRDKPFVQLPLAKTRVTASQGDDGASTARQSTLLIFPTRNHESGESGLSQHTAFVCTLPAKLMSGQRIHVTIGESTFDVPVNAAKAVVCQTPVLPNQQADCPTYTQPNQDTKSPSNDRYGKPMAVNSLCNNSESALHVTEPVHLVHNGGANPNEPILPKMPSSQAVSISSAIHYRGYVPRQFHSHRSWPPAGPADISRSAIPVRPFPSAFYHRKRARSMQTSSNIRQRKREISIAGGVSPTQEGRRSAGAHSNTDSTDDTTTVAGFAQKCTPSTVDGVNLEEIKRFAKLFKMKRLSLGLTQTQVGQTLSLTNGPAYSQSAICRFEKLDITPKSAQKIKPVLERWLQEVDDQIKMNGGIVNMQRSLHPPLRSDPKSTGGDPIPIPSRHPTYAEVQLPEKHDIDPTLTTIESDSSETVVSPGSQNCQDNAANCKRRKRRTSFTPQALEVLNEYFERNSHPSGIEMTSMAERLNYEREVIRVWFCNKRQALKNTFKKLKTVQ